jgi:hypothetical protein
VVLDLRDARLGICAYRTDAGVSWSYRNVNGRENRAFFDKLERLIRRSRGIAPLVRDALVTVEASSRT